MAATRRGFLMVAGLAGVATGEASAADDLMVLGRRLRLVLSGPESARQIANAYLGGTDWRRAAMDLDMVDVLAPAVQITGTDALRTWLGARIRTDFAMGAVIDVDGWRLSRTEVGACLLACGAD